MGDKKYLIVSDQKIFGKRFDHFIAPKSFWNHIVISRKKFSKLKFQSWKFLVWMYVIFIEFVDVNKALKWVVPGITDVILHQINEF